MHEQRGDSWYAESRGWERVGYIDRWRFVVACFTREAAERYIEENRHNLTEPRVWVWSAHRNREWCLAAALFRGGDMMRGTRLGTGQAGLLTLWTESWALHLGVRPDHWVWGHETEAYDLCAELYGAGPLFLLVRLPGLVGSHV